MVCENYPYDNDHQDGRIQDKKGDTPYHMVMEHKCSPNTIKICEILSRHPINPSLPNNCGKKLVGGKVKEKRDQRYIIIQKAAEQFQRPKKKSRKKASDLLPSTSSPKQDQESSISKSPTVNLQDANEVLHHVNEMLQQLSKEPQSYFEPPLTYKRQRSVPQKATDTQKKIEDELSQAVSKNDQKAATVSTADQPSSVKRDIDVSDVAKNFEDCTWEVECTDKVKKFFANTKVQRHEKKQLL